MMRIVSSEIQNCRPIVVGAADDQGNLFLSLFMRLGPISTKKADSTYNNLFRDITNISIIIDSDILLPH